MEFGRLAKKEVQYVDHSLPDDGRITSLTLPGSPAANSCEFYVGCAKWGRKEWKGLLYPKGTKGSDFLTQYARHFDSLELNACFFTIPSVSEIKRLKEQVDASGNENFLFFPKISRNISHVNRLVNSGDLVNEFMNSIKEFGASLGPIFLQVSDNYGPKYFDGLKAFLEDDLPKGHKFMLEVRHPEWLDEEIHRNRFFDLLAKHEVGSVMSDASGRRDCLHMELPTRDLFVRFVGNGEINSNLDRERIDAWIDRIGKWVEMGLENVYFFVHQLEDIDVPALAGYAISEFNKKLNAGIREVNFQKKY